MPAVTTKDCRLARWNLQGIPAPHADDARGHDHRRPAGLHQGL